MILLSISEFIGRFHPVLVHLPIGFLLLAALFFYLSIKEKYQALSSAVYYSLLFGAIAAALSCITGFLLSQSGEYEEGLVSGHQWLGIGLTIVSFICLYAVKNKKSFAKYLMILMSLLIIITGHLGGTLTHGEGYLFGGSNKTKAAVKPIADVQQAVVYIDIIQPILQTKCYGCHGASKQKGKLRLDEQSFILKGGESGHTVVAGNTSGSELIERINLDKTDDDHMPPASKPQLTKEQIALLHWWVQEGADFTGKTAAYKQPDNIKSYLLALQNGTVATETIIAEKLIPEKEVSKAPDSIIQQLQAMDISVSTVAKGSNYLTVSFIALDTVTAKQMELLKAISPQLLWLKMSGTALTDNEAVKIGELKNLSRLSIDRTSITDKAIAVLGELKQLEYLNLSFTNTTDEAIKSLSSLTNLKQVYLYQTKMTATGYTALIKMLPSVKVDTGGYQVQKLASDTMLVKAKKK